MRLPGVKTTINYKFGVYQLSGAAAVVLLSELNSTSDSVGRQAALMQLAVTLSRIKKQIAL